MSTTQTALPTPTSTPVTGVALACVHCREKKLRCGRERPTCGSCKRDGIDCEYAQPGKRVNHIKLLCDSVGGVLERLNTMELELSRLTGILQSSRAQSVSSEDDTLHSSADGFPFPDTSRKGSNTPLAIRGKQDMIDHYHGSRSLVVLCAEIRSTILAERRRRHTLQRSENNQQEQSNQTVHEIDEAVEQRLVRLCDEAGVEELFEVQMDCSPVRLPPKQFLTMVLAQFFRMTDHTTDIFVQASFRASIEQIYGRPYQTCDEAWAICFNTIIFLVLDSETPNNGNNTAVESQFLLPFLAAVRAALNNPRAMMAPKLINVQALILLSIASRQCHAGTISDTIFAQACMLARKMGLHQSHVVPAGITPEEAEERRKVLLSLFTQDKLLSITKTSLCWLPGFDCNLPGRLEQINFADPTCVSRVQLARMQEDIYQSFYSAESQMQSYPKKIASLLRIEKNLHQWATENNIFGLPHDNVRTATLQLDLLATNIGALAVSGESAHTDELLICARASCQILLAACGKHDQLTQEHLQKLLPATQSSKIFGDHGLPNAQTALCSNTEVFQSSIDDQAVIRRYGLLEAFSMSGAFDLIASIVHATSEEAVEQAEADFHLLCRVSICFAEFDPRGHHTHAIARIARVLQELLDIVRLSQNLSADPLEDSMTTPDFPLSSGSELSSLSTSSLSDFAGVVNTATFSPMPSLPWKTSSMDASRTSPLGLPMFDPQATLQLSTGLQQGAFGDMLPHAEPYRPRKRRQMDSDPVDLMFDVQDMNFDILH